MEGDRRELSKCLPFAQGREEGNCGNFNEAKESKKNKHLWIGDSQVKDSVPKGLQAWGWDAQTKGQDTALVAW
jgi:hypothetical protein